MIKNVYEDLCSFEVLYQTHQKLMKSRRYKTQVVKFDRNATIELMKLLEELQNRTYNVSPYTCFTIKYPKKREIQMLSYRDKIVQRAICDNILLPYIQSHVIYDNAACLKGKGVQFALDRVTAFLYAFYNKNQTNGYILKTDIKSYYASMDHQILKQQMAQLIKDQELLNLIYMLIDSYGDTKGIPMGNQISQVFAIYYLNRLDRLVKEKLRVKYYSRYMDDCILILNDKAEAKHVLIQMQNHIETLHLSFNKKTKIVPIKNGIDYLGFHFYLTQTGKVIKKLRTSNKKTTVRKLKNIKYQRKQGIITDQKMKQKWHGIASHLKKGNTYRLRKKLVDRYNLGG